MHMLSSSRTETFVKSTLILTIHDLSCPTDLFGVGQKKHLSLRLQDISHIHDFLLNAMAFEWHHLSAWSPLFATSRTMQTITIKVILLLNSTSTEYLTLQYDLNCHNFGKVVCMQIHNGRSFWCAFTVTLTLEEKIELAQQCCFYYPPLPTMLKHSCGSLRDWLLIIALLLVKAR